MSNSTFACLRCRIAWKAGTIVCTRCGVTGLNMGTKWRAPKANNLKAWKQIAEGVYWWDEKAIAKSPRIQRDLAWRDWLFWRKVRSKK